MYQLFFTEDELRSVIKSLLKDEKQELVHLIVEQIFKKDLTKNDVNSILYKED